VRDDGGRQPSDEVAARQVGDSQRLLLLLAGGGGVEVEHQGLLAGVQGPFQLLRLQVNTRGMGIQASLTWLVLAPRGGGTPRDGWMKQLLLQRGAAEHGSGTLMQRADPVL
jgi:hypothetical protein